MIDSENYYYSLAANGTTTIGTRMAKIQPNYIWYNIEEQISSTLKTRDGRDEILISELISQGLNNTNTSASGTYQEQWLSSSYIKIADKNDYVEYGLFYTDGEGDVEGAKLYNSYETGGNIVVGYKLRPVVVLDTNNIKLTLVNNKWEIAKLEQ